MKIIKILGSVVAALFLIILAIPNFLPKHAYVERSIQVQALPATAFAYLTDLNSFKKWNPFIEMEPQAQIEIQGTGVGASYYWKGNRTGEGRMTLTRLEQNTLVQVKMDFIKPMPGEAEARWRIEPIQNFSKVTWSMDQDLSYFNRYFGLFMDKMLGAHFDKGLQNLKKQLESLPVPTPEPSPGATPSPGPAQTPAPAP